MNLRTQKFHMYFKQWIELYKEGAVRPVTYQKYQMSHKHLVTLAPDLHMDELKRRTYQELINEFAANHEKQTTLDFHHHLKAAILDALDEGILEQDPTRKVVIKGTVSRVHKVKFLNQHELTKLLALLDLDHGLDWDYFLLLIAKTGLRFGEALGVTPMDFDMAKLTLTINKTWDYKSATGSFAETKNTASVRKVPLDWQVAMQFATQIKVSRRTSRFLLQMDSEYTTRQQMIFLSANVSEQASPSLAFTGYATLMRLYYYTQASRLDPLQDDLDTPI
ncbi:MAG: Integrase [Lacticaseibacillus casei]